MLFTTTASALDSINLNKIFFKTFEIYPVGSVLDLIIILNFNILANKIANKLDWNENIKILLNLILKNRIFKHINVLNILG